jgi:hypothetical protein
MSCGRRVRIDRGGRVRRRSPASPRHCARHCPRYGRRLGIRLAPRLAPSARRQRGGNIAARHLGASGFMGWCWSRGAPALVGTSRGCTAAVWGCCLDSGRSLQRACRRPHRAIVAVRIDSTATSELILTNNNMVAVIRNGTPGLRESIRSAFATSDSTGRRD